MLRYCREDKTFLLMNINPITHCLNYRSYLYGNNNNTGSPCSFKGHLCPRPPSAPRNTKYSKATIYRHAKLPINDVATFDKRKHNKGRPRKLSIRDERNIIRHLRLCRTTIGYFSASRLRTMAGISPDVSPWCIRRILNRHGYQNLHSRKKGLKTLLPCIYIQ